MVGVEGKTAPKEQRPRSGSCDVRLVKRATKAAAAASARQGGWDKNWQGIDRLRMPLIVEFLSGGEGKGGQEAVMKGCRKAFFCAPALIRDCQVDGRKKMFGMIAPPPPHKAVALEAAISAKAG